MNTLETRTQRPQTLRWLMLAPLAACFMLFSGSAAAQGGAITPKAPEPALDAPAVPSTEQGVVAPDAVAKPSKQAEADRAATKDVQAEATPEQKKQIEAAEITKKVQERIGSVKGTVEVKVDPFASAPPATVVDMSQQREVILIKEANIHGEEVTQPN